MLCSVIHIMQKAMKGCLALVQPSAILAREVAPPPLHIGQGRFPACGGARVRNVFAWIVMRLTNHG